MATRIDDYRTVLRTLDDWTPYLLQESRLPGPRANLELGHAVAEEGDQERFEYLLSFGPQQAPANTPGEFLACCGVLGLGRLLAEGRRDLLAVLRRHANDPRWRMREVVAMALQRLGATDMPALLDEMDRWARGSFLEQRAAAAALCEPALLHRPADASRVLALLDQVTASLAGAAARGSDDFQALRKGLAYCWSVAVAALPAEGQAAMERWLDSDDRDVRWIMKQNLQKKRLARLDPAWVASCLQRLQR